jgi:phosphopantothenoylcysteine decarboxylase / phosphopantothenate---cysteine ligase
MTLLPRLQGKHIVVGVAGSIAAYRACDVMRRLRDLGATVRPAPTQGAQAFCTPKLFEALCAMPALTSSLDVERGIIPHVEEAHRAAAVVVAPASADILAKMAAGIADEAILSLLLSFRGPVIVAPAMESNMWNHEATTANVALLRQRGVEFVGPVEGSLASGRSGSGRMASIDAIVESVVAATTKKTMQGHRVLVTAGPTVEDIDPVRFLSNRSSGKMGLAVARTLALRGADVHLVHGPMKVEPISLKGLTLHPVRSAADMHQQVHALVGGCDIAVLAAAVADYTTDKAARKLKKSDGLLEHLALTPTTDILASLGASPTPPMLVGFAAETHDVERYAQAKREKKRCDMVVGNDVSGASVGFDVDDNRVFICTADRAEWLPTQTKEGCAEQLVDAMEQLLRSRAHA